VPPHPIGRRRRVDVLPSVVGDVTGHDRFKSCEGPSNQGSSLRSCAISSRDSPVASMPTAMVLGVIRTSLPTRFGCRATYSAARFAPRSARAGHPVKTKVLTQSLDIIDKPVTA